MYSENNPKARLWKAAFEGDYENFKKLIEEGTIKKLMNIMKGSHYYMPSFKEIDPMKEILLNISIVQP